MELLLVFFGVIFFAVFIKILLTGSKRASFIKNEQIPENLGIQTENLLPVIQRLENSLPHGYRENIKNRVLKDHPRWEDHEYDWAFFELKRYFILNSLLKTVPMFSEKVDEIWHEMLMFTRDYSQFSQNFYGEYLHHSPNMDSTPIPGERAFFDWIYLSLFETSHNSRRIWGGFLKNPIKKEILEDFRSLNEEDLLAKYFRESSDWLSIKKELITKLKREISEADAIKLGNKPLEFSKPGSVYQYSYLLLPAVYYSFYESDRFDDYMNELLPKELAKDGASSGVSCSGYACSSPTDDDSGGGHDSGGGSSCSSCGGGCSS
ncbi:hypothetical protein J7I93_14870 [Bacillus sp. ISL-47]|uniref:hypothetical protein n=1 Tax=Bacillus sp. ISL-47 TaxID=2819130 RepID=UPI001BE5B650|nr:hypothetical protein [Bacillus sp. ISL-47]MBT2689473.1 hypothetical protein [Bacillus sp. ISL-47]MBT2708289.1 hypothetical protein [Pseudomonas sp. ISL-84]